MTHAINLPYPLSRNGAVERVEVPDDALAPDAALDVVTLADLEDQVAARARRGGTRAGLTTLRQRALRLAALALAPPAPHADAARSLLDAVRDDLDAERDEATDRVAWLTTRD